MIVGLEFTRPCDDSDECIPEVSLLIDLGGTLPMALGGSLVGAGFGLQARRQALLDRRRGPGAGGGMKRRGALGWALFGVGLGVYTATRLAAPFGCPSDGCFVGVWEGGYWASATLVGAGLVMGPYARGYRVEQLRHAEVSFAPLGGPFGLRGLAMRGRF